MLEIIFFTLLGILVGTAVGIMILVFSVLYILHDKDYRRKEKEWESKNLTR